MKKPSKKILDSWGGTFPPEFYSAINKVVGAHHFHFVGVDVDGRLRWSRPCSDLLRGSFIIEIEVLNATTETVAFKTKFFFCSIKVVDVFEDVRARFKLQSSNLFSFGSKQITLLTGTLDYYDAELHKPGNIQIMHYPSGGSESAVFAWTEMFHRTTLPLFFELEDTNQIVQKLLEFSPEQHRLTGRSRFVSAAPILFAATIQYLAGQQEGMRKTLKLKLEHSLSSMNKQELDFFECYSATKMKSDTI